MVRPARASERKMSKRVMAWFRQLAAFFGHIPLRIALRDFPSCPNVESILYGDLVWCICTELGHAHGDQEPEQETGMATVTPATPSTSTKQDWT